MSCQASLCCGSGEPARLLPQCRSTSSHLDFLFCVNRPTLLTCAVDGNYTVQSRYLPSILSHNRLVTCLALYLALVPSQATICNPVTWAFDLALLGLSGSNAFRWCAALTPLSDALTRICAVPIVARIEFVRGALRCLPISKIGYRQFLCATRQVRQHGSFLVSQVTCAVSH